MMTTYTKRETWEALRAKVDARKGNWTAEGTPDADRALIGELLRQVGAWEAHAEFIGRTLADLEADRRHARDALRTFFGLDND